MKGLSEKTFLLIIIFCICLLTIGVLIESIIAVLSSAVIFIATLIYGVFK